MKLKLLCLLAFVVISLTTTAQQITGVIKDESSKETLIGATVVIKGTTEGATTDIDGKFTISTKQSPPFVLVISSLGYDTKEFSVVDISQALNFKMSSKLVNLKGVTVTGSRVSEKQKEAPLTIESIDLIAIKQIAQNSFYEALGTLKGVDLTSASMGFTVINTRGFNSTSPVRSLQLIDGVDNQSPGLNFSLGNFLGSSELDVLKVDLIAGASSAYYGPNAFNGVISMTTRSPFVKPGLEVSFKAGERSLIETAIRWAQVVKNKKGEDKLGYKVNLFFMKAHDWEANNRTATPESRNDTKNPGGYDAVNVYGDEYYSTSDYSKLPSTNPGLITYYRTGYAENSLVDYNTQNFKASALVTYKIKPTTELTIGSALGNGTTVYQGDNRYSLKDILFLQHKIELKKEDKYFIRAYMTDEDAGKSYDAFFTALIMQNASKSDFFWSQTYRGFWTLPANNYFNKERNFPGYPQAPVFGSPNYQENYQIFLNSINPFLLSNYYDSLQLYHGKARAYSDAIVNPAQNSVAFYVPGTARFDSLFNVVTSRKSNSEGGSRFFDQSKLYHVQGEYKFTPKFCDIIIGSNFRMYRPTSDGTIFSDTAGRKIKNQEWGTYIGLEKKFIDNKLKINLTTRIDKNQNFNTLFSPALSAVYSINPRHIIRGSFSAAIRNPTLTDQYLYYNVGRAKLLGNITGYDSLVTIPSLIDAYSGFTSIAKLVYFSLDPVRPEKVKTVEVGYRASLFDHLYADANYYYSLYTDFIGYTIGANVTTSKPPGLPDQITINDVYRVSSNAKDKVNSQGFSIGLNYYIGKFFSLSGNYSWNELNKHGSNDPIIPAYNTPRNKFNLGFSGRDIETTLFNSLKVKNYSFNINYKWIQGFLFEGSPQFTGEIANYQLFDVQVSKSIPKIKSVFKAGASNLLNNEHYEVYGGPLVGRLAYISIVVALTK